MQRNSIENSCNSGRPDQAQKRARGQKSPENGSKTAKKGMIFTAMGTLAVAEDLVRWARWLGLTHNSGRLSSPGR